MLAQCLSLSKMQYCFWSFTKHAHNYTYVGLFLVLYHFSLCSFSHLVLFVKCEMLYRLNIQDCKFLCLFMFVTTHVLERFVWDRIYHSGQEWAHHISWLRVLECTKELKETFVMYVIYEFLFIMIALYQVITILTEILIANIRTDNNSAVI
jgi:hypothetical protein